MDFRAVLHPDTLANSHDESTAFCASADSGFESGAGGQPLEGGCVDGSSAAVARGQVTGGAAVSLCGVEESAASQELQLRDAV